MGGSSAAIDTIPEAYINTSTHYQGNGTSYTNASSAHLNASHAAQDHVTVGCTASSHHHWWRDNSEQHFTSGITLMTMIVVMVLFEMVHHKIHRWCAQQDSANVDEHSEAYQIDKKEKQIRKYLTSEDETQQLKSHHGSHLLPLLHRMSDEMMFLGFLAFFLWILKVSGFFDAIFLGVK
jgi:hypothetical protein